MDLNRLTGCGLGIIISLSCLAVGCDVVKESITQSESSEGDVEESAKKVPDNFFSDIPLPDGATVSSIRADEFGDPSVEFEVPSSAQPLNAWYTIESSKRGWLQIGSTERINGGGTGLFSHSSEDRYFELEIEPAGEGKAKIVITYRGSGI